MTAYEINDFPLFEEDSEYQKLVSSYQAIEATLPYKSQSNLDFTTMLTTEPSSFFPVGDSYSAFQYFNNDSIQTQPIFTQQRVEFRVPTSPSLSSGQSTGVSAISSDHGSPFIGTEEWPFSTVDDVYNNEYTPWNGVPSSFEQTEIKTEAFVDPSLISTISSMSRQTSVQEPVSPFGSPPPTSPRTMRTSTNMRASPYSRPPSGFSTSHKRSISHTFVDEFINDAPLSPPSKERSQSNVSSPGSSTTQTANRDSWCGECGKAFRDIKAHQLTHQLERPEKCPISTCDYAKKGFARKYDCQRHTLTHYKGTMVCGFCPGTGLASEKTFNRADVFKRHLMSVHNVEQTPPNGRTKKSASASSSSSTKSLASPRFHTFPKDVTGMCSTCSVTFQTAQQFYEHLDECVLSKVCAPEPTGDINAANMAQVDLEEMQATLAVHGLLDDYEESDISEEDCDDENDKSFKSTRAKANKKQR